MNYLCSKPGRVFPAILAALLFLVPAVVLYAQQGSGKLLDARNAGRKSVAEIHELAKPMFDIYGVPDLQYAAVEYRLAFKTTDFDGTPVTAYARLFVPAPALESGGEYPLLVFGSGTTGVGDHCAPSLEDPSVRRWGHYEANMLSYAANGIITVFPDYVGFNDAMRPQRYFSKYAEGHLMLDTARAVRKFFESRREDAVLGKLFLAGYSQGGHAAFSAADLRAEYAPEITISGIVSYGGTMNVETLLREGSYYAPFIFYTYEHMYGTERVNPEEYLMNRWMETFETDVLSMSVDQFQRYYPFDGTLLYDPDFYSALMNDRLAAEYPGLKAALDENIAGLSGHGVPALIIQGSRDVIITTTEQDKYVSLLCERGSAVEYLVLDQVRHRFTRAAGFRATLEWMDKIVAGEQAPSNCSDIRSR